MKVAKYRNTECGFETVNEVSEYYDNDNGYIRISEIIEVEFVALNDDELLKKEVDAIDGQIQKVQAEAHVRTNELKQRKAELLALPDLSNDGD